MGLGPLASVGDREAGPEACPGATGGQGLGQGMGEGAPHSPGRWPLGEPGRGGGGESGEGCGGQQQQVQVDPDHGLEGR